MKKLIPFLSFTLLIVVSANAQSGWYTTSGSETIFSWNSPIHSAKDNTVVRFAPVLNFQSMLNKDLSKSLGIYTGVNLRSVGFITDDPADATIRRKFIKYNIGIPLGFKVGKMGKMFLYAGGNIEYAFNYKEKTFVNGDKESKKVYWFTDRIRTFQTAVHAGVQFHKGMNIKFQYYINSFFNPDRTDVYDTLYKRFDSNIFFVSLNANLFKGTKFTYID
jgi:hypothetical protein